MKGLHDRSRTNHTTGSHHNDNIATRGDINNHDNVAERERRGQQRGDVGEGDLGGKGGKCSSGKQGQWLLQRVMARLGATTAASGEVAVRAGTNGGGDLHGP
ncbi:hypothetical protein B296_00032701 [Ensete ventricosum]|uniref:Uncharacterized protein n=1 Tax=Ensete ventricosum TaxID=4639 RepID=A0A426YTF7_ENSVE|nr:hypothetical protein B296_00032701 [Ensete ventricosum]